MDRVPSVKGNLKGLQAKSSPEHYVNQRWRRCWVTRLNYGETYVKTYLIGKQAKGKRPIRHIDVFSVRMDGTECAITGGSTVDS